MALDETRRAPPPEPARGPETGTVGKAMAVLDIIAAADAPLRFTQVLARVDQPRGTLHRQIANLVREGLVDVQADGRYVPGLRLLKLASRAWSRNSVRAVAEPHVRALHEATGETVHLGVLNGLEVVYLDKLESRQTVRMHSQVGNASPLYCTGIGKAMLARLDPADAAALAERFDYRPHTPATVIRADALLAELDRIRSEGVAHDREEHEPGIRCVACAVRAGDAVAGLSVTGPAFRLADATVERVAGAVRDGARALEADLAHRLGPRQG